MRRGEGARGAPAAARIVAVGLALALAAVAAGAVNKWLAFGDSIMVGSTWPFVDSEDCSICPATFDCSGGCSYLPSVARESCGIPRRLDVWLDGSLGGPDDVLNLGKGAERTMEGYMRLRDMVLPMYCSASPGDCIALVLMHGTNDMFHTISPESATANLQLMIAEAKARNVDVLLMTVIRRINEPGNTKWSSYRDLVLALAMTENVPWVDPWLTLCDNATCYNTNYWVAGSCGGPGELQVGHLDPQGYDVMHNLVTAAFPATEPGTPSTTSPVGDILDTTPDFVWPEVAGARWYALEVDGATTWWEAAEHCGSGTCTVNPGLALAKGSHSWKVQGRNLRGLGLFSAAAAFEIWGVPGGSVPMDPEGIFYDANPASPPFGWEPFQWSAAAEATDYDLVVSDGGGVVYTDSFDSSACPGSTCSGAPAEGLADGAFTWTVKARNPAASGPLSAPLGFEIEAFVPGEATPTGPIGEHFEPLAPLYRWLAAPGATEYDLEVRDSGENVDASAGGLLASAVCSGGQCSHQGGILASPDVYTLRVLGSNPLGDGPWSSPGAEFTILACADPSQKTLESLAPPPVTGPPAVVVQHCGPVTAAAMSPYVVEASGDLTVNTRDGFTAHTGFTVAGSLTIKSP